MKFLLLSSHMIFSYHHIRVFNFDENGDNILKLNFEFIGFAD